MDKEREELDGQATDAEPDEAPVDGPGKGSGDDLGDTSQDSPGHD